MSQLSGLEIPYPADQLPSGIEILFNGHNVDCWCILDGEKADIDYYLGLQLDAVVVSPERLKFVDVYFDKHYVLTVNSDGVATQNNLENFYRNKGKIFIPNKNNFQIPLPSFLIDWEWSFQDKILREESQKLRQEVAEGQIPF